MGRLRYPPDNRPCVLNARGARIYSGMTEGRRGVIVRVKSVDGWLVVRWDGNTGIAVVPPVAVDIGELP